MIVKGVDPPVSFGLPHVGASSSNCPHTQSDKETEYPAEDCGGDPKLCHSEDRSRGMDHKPDDETDDGSNDAADRHPDASSTSKDGLRVHRVSGSGHDSALSRSRGLRSRMSSQNVSASDYGRHRELRSESFRASAPSASRLRPCR